MIHACYIIHYGKEWLYWSIRSVMDLVDQVHVFYTAVPTHGHRSDIRNPDNGKELFDICKYFGSKLIWWDCTRFQFAHEGLHRTYAVNMCAGYGADIVMVSDTDEIWDCDLIDAYLHEIDKNVVRNYRVGMRHFWRSLKWVCDDPAMPVRFIRPSVNENSEYYLSGEGGKVFHMGYAQKSELIKYKMSIHGHKNELRPNWFEDKFMTWRPGDNDVHPTNLNFWNPKQYLDDGE